MKSQDETDVRIVDGKEWRTRAEQAEADCLRYATDLKEAQDELERLQQRIRKLLKEWPERFSPKHDLQEILEDKTPQAEAERDHNQRVAAKMADKLTEAEAVLAECRKEAEKLILEAMGMYQESQAELERLRADIRYKDAMILGQDRELQRLRIWMKWTDTALHFLVALTHPWTARRSGDGMIRARAVMVRTYIRLMEKLNWRTSE